MRLHAPLSFVCTFIFGQLFDRKRRFEDSFVLFGENGEDASGNVMQQPFDTPWCPPLPSGAPGGHGSSWFGALKPGDGERAGCAAGCRTPWPPSVEWTIPSRRTERRIEQPRSCSAARGRLIQNTAASSCCSRIAEVGDGQHGAGPGKTDAALSLAG